MRDGGIHRLLEDEDFPGIFPSGNGAQTQFRRKLGGQVLKAVNGHVCLAIPEELPPAPW